jgi:3-dehydroquinate dehydratase-2
MNILLINGPNINFLGIREPGIYGARNYSELIALVQEEGKRLKVAVDCFQSNCEGEIVDAIQNAYGRYDGIIINPAAYTHYSIAIYDALKAIPIPAIEVHISNTHAREEFRHRSVTAPACVGQIMGLGFKGYVMALMALVDMNCETNNKG